jgi:hypothetical protein
MDYFGWITKFIDALRRINDALRMTILQDKLAELQAAGQQESAALINPFKTAAERTAVTIRLAMLEAKAERARAQAEREIDGDGE